VKIIIIKDKIWRTKHLRKKRFSEKALKEKEEHKELNKFFFLKRYYNMPTNINAFLKIYMFD
jgi:hypothetical protein